MSDVTPTPQPSLKVSWLIATLVTFTFFALIAGYASRMTDDYTDYEQQGAATRIDTLAKLQHDEQAQIHPVDDQGNPTAEWVDQDKKIIRIPIEEAMAKTLDTLKNDAVHQCEAIPVAAAAPAPAPTTSAAPIASSMPATNTTPATPAVPSTNAPAAKPPATKKTP